MVMDAPVTNVSSLPECTVVHTQESFRRTRKTKKTMFGGRLLVV
jgi:hypothetical protein